MLGHRLARGAPESSSAGHAAPPDAGSKAPLSKVSAAQPAPTPVWEIYFSTLRNEAGEIASENAMADLIAVPAGVLANEQFPLDGVAVLFRDEPSVAVLVDARGDGARRVVAQQFVRVLTDVAGDATGVRILDLRDEDSSPADTRSPRDREGIVLPGSYPKPGFGAPFGVPGLLQAKAHALSRSCSGGSGSRSWPPLAAVDRGSSGSPAAGGQRMAPFVLDTLLRALDDRTRTLAERDPAAGARILASRAIAGRIGMIVGEAVEVRLGGVAPGQGDGSGDDRSVWRADEVIVGTNPFAVERVGHRILSNTRKAQGLPTVLPHPILEAAAAAKIPGADFATIAWKKAAL